MFLYLGRNVVPLLLNDLFGESYKSLPDLDPLQSTMPDLNTQISTQLRNIMAYISDSRPAKSLLVQITRQTLDGAELELHSLLVEDRNNEAQSYHEYLAYLHRQINLEVLRSFYLTFIFRRAETGTVTKIACGQRDYLLKTLRHCRSFHTVYGHLSTI
jgi:hypothetical protein